MDRTSILRKPWRRYSSISFGGRSARTAANEVAGVDVSDEAGALPPKTFLRLSAMESFMPAWPILAHLSNDLLLGAVNEPTKSGTKPVPRGEGFRMFGTVSRRLRLRAAFLPRFQQVRNTARAAAGVGSHKDNLVFFAEGRAINRIPFAPLRLGAPFATVVFF